MTKIKLKRIEYAEGDLGCSYFAIYVGFWHGQKLVYTYSYDIKDGEEITKPYIEGKTIRKIAQRGNYCTLYF